ncbi:MAG: L-aspartate oxidase [Chloroflexi bacterium RBG_16_50_9]|nr:MAG: L-aspartate oxidase [Chloroflexi bacterium RBG_16_50_9]
MKQSGQVKYDFVIVGSGIAGLYTALLAKKYGSVLVITKGSIDDTNTKFAQGGIAAAIGKDDSPELHFNDTIAAGDGLCNEEAVHILVDEAADRIADLVNFSVPFDTLDGEIALTREAAHSMPRILHAGGDTTGEHIETTLSGQVRSAKIRVLEDSLVTEIVVEDGTVKGIRVLDCRTSSVEEFGCRYLILATGGAGQLFKVNTNSSVVTGDGIALAYDAGAEITDMEFYQFHPTALHLPGVTPFLISEAVRGEGGTLRNVEGRRFMLDYTPAGDLAPRDIVSRSVLAEMKKTASDKVFIDVTHLPPAKITTRFPHIYRFCLEQGLDITQDLIPVAPAAHYMIGGVKTNVWGETSIAGLFACGETACTGIHGANRLASNSLLEAVVFGKRIIKRIGDGDKTAPSPDSWGLEVHHTLSAKRVPRAALAPSLSALQQLHWDKVGIIRNREGLTEAANTLAAWQKTLSHPADRPSYELSNLIATGRLVTEAALLREESRGAHFRTDFPQSLPQWQRHIVFSRDTK